MLGVVVLGVVVASPEFDVAPDGTVLGAVLGVDVGVVLAEVLALGSVMHENWSHLALNALMPALWSFSAEWAIDTSLWKRWFVKSWLATNLRYCEYSQSTNTKAMIARPSATTGKKDVVRDEGDKSMVSTLEDMMEGKRLESRSALYFSFKLFNVLFCG